MPAQYKRIQIEQEINKRINADDYEFKDLLEAYKNCSNDMSEREEQFYLYESAYYKSKHNGENAVILADFIQALQKTFEGYTVQTDIENIVLMPDEMIIFYNIAYCLCREGKRQQAITAANQLYKLYQKYDLMDSIMPLGLDAIARMLSQWLLADGQLDMALQVADKGCASCTKYGRMKNLPYLLHTKSLILLGLGKEEGRILFKRTYMFFEALGNKEMMAEINLHKEVFYECGK